MRVLLTVALGGLLLVAAGAPAAAQAMGEAFLLDRPVQASEAEQVAHNFEALLVQKAYAVRSVKLESATPVLIATMFRGTQRQELAAGTILHSASADGRVFCALKGRDAHTACLEDTKGRGVFDGGMSATMGSSGGDYMAFMAREGIMPATFDNNPYTLANPVTYSEIPPSEGPATHMAVHWFRTWGSIKPGQPVTINLWLSFGGDKSGHGFNSPYQTVQVDQAHGALVQIGGALIQLLGFTPDGSIRYRVVRPLPPGPARYGIF